MGWSFGWKSRAELIEHLTRTQENESGKWETTKHCTVGNVLWAVQVHTDKQAQTVTPFILCCLLQGGGEWGYKDMTESMGPYYYTCPVAYFDLVPEANKNWRAKVREHHAFKKAQRDAIKRLKVGDTLMLKAGCRPPSIIIASLSPLRGTHNFTTYRVGLKHVDLGVAAPGQHQTDEEKARLALIESGAMLRCSALGLNDQTVHVLFQGKAGTEGFYMSHEAYDAIPLGTNATPDDYRKHGELRPAPATFENGQTTKELVPA